MLASRVTTKAIFFDRQTLYLLGIFGIARIASFFLYGHNIMQAILVFAILMAFGMLYFKDVKYAWFILLGELFLGGSGHLLEFFGLSLRSVLLLNFLFLWFVHYSSEKEHHHKLKVNHFIFPLLLFLTLAVVVAIVLGLVHGHTLVDVIRDAVPYTYFFLLLPLYHHLTDHDVQEFLIRLLTVFFIGGALFSLFTFVYFAADIGVLQDGYYHWYRNAIAGKITDMTTGYFRIVAPEHLLIVPGMLLISSLLMRAEKHHPGWYYLLASGAIVLALNLSRTYFLALLIGLLILKFKHSYKQFFKISILTISLTILMFIGTSLVASGGRSLGLELFGLRFLSIAQPTLEVSTYTRMTLTEPIFELIGQHLIFGNGLGATLSFVDPVLNTQVITTQFDWGWFELLAEFGIIGILPLLLILLIIIYELFIKIATLSDYQDFYVGLLAGIFAMMIMTITSPALFHVFGIFYIVLIMSIAIKPIHLFDRILTLLYRTFHRLER